MNYDKEFQKILQEIKRNGKNEFSPESLIIRSHIPENVVYKKLRTAVKYKMIKQIEDRRLKRFRIL